MNLQELRQKFAGLCDSQQAIVNAAVAGGRGMTDDEKVRFDALQAEIDGLSHTIKMAEAVEARSRQLSEPVTPINTPNLHIVKKDESRFTSFGEQLRAVYRASGPQPAVDPRLNMQAAASGMSESVTSDGGFLVQQDFVSGLLEKTFETGKLPAKCQRIPITTNANGLKMNGVDETSRADGSRFGGIQAYWEGEAAEFTATKPKFRQINLDLRKLTGLCYGTDELLADAGALEAFIRNAFAKEFGFKLDDALINGSGAGRPLGIINSGCLVTVQKETGQAAKTIVAENIVNMYSRNYSESASEWYVNRDVLPQLYKMSVTVGTGGAPVFVPAGGYSALPYNTLLGRPIVPLEQCKTLGTVGDIVFGDFSDYLYCDKGGVNAAVSIHVRFIYDESVFRFIYRVDGQPVRASALTPANGTNTLSAFVALATRA